jgi:N6-adenosine-specific RNA methylase IME4
MQDPFPDLKRNHYGAILSDPPWSFTTWSEKGEDRSPEYETQSMEWLKALPVGDLAAENCVLFMWVCWPTLPDALEVLKAWGFEYKTCAFAWMKADVSTIDLFPDPKDAYMGMGYWTRSNSEPCLLATRGKPKRLHADVRQGIIAPRREHSRKPEGVHERIERLVDGPYCELFGRQRRKKWDVWGNQTDKFTEVA